MYDSSHPCMLIPSGWRGVFLTFGSLSFTVFVGNASTHFYSLFFGLKPRHSEVKFTVVEGFARTDDGHNHRQGATSCTEPSDSTQRAVKSSHGLGHLTSPKRVSTAQSAPPGQTFLVR